MKHNSNRILGFLEIEGTESGPVPISAFSIDVKSESPIMHMDIIPSQSGREGISPKHNLLAIHEDSQVSCYDQRLEGMHWSQQIELESSKSVKREPVHVSYAAFTGLQDGRKALLKHREDILAALDADSDDAESSLLILLSSTGFVEKSPRNCVLFQIYRIRPTRPAYSGMKSHNGPHLLLSHTLTSPQEFQASIKNYTLHTSSGTLYEQSANGVTVYDLSGTTPRITKSLMSDHDGIASCLRLSSNLLATSTQSSLSILGLPYGSLQGRTTVSDDPSTHNHKRSNANVQLLLFFAQLNVIVVLDGRRLIAVPISISSPKQPSQKRKRDDLLVGSLACGSCTHRVNPGKHAAKRNGSIFGTYINNYHPNDPSSKESCDLEQLLQEGELGPSDRLTTQEHTILNPQSGQVDQRRVSYLLSKIFKVSNFEQPNNNGNSRSVGGLEVNIWPAKVCDWLLQLGLFAVDRVASSLRHHKLLEPGVKLAPGALTDALARWDPSLSVLDTLLASATPLSPVEVAHALLAVMQIIKDDNQQGNAKLLTNGEGKTSLPSEWKMQVINGGELQKQMPHSPRCADANIAVLYLVLRRLQVYPSNTLTQALRQTFSRSQLRCLVDLFRMEVARNGWLSFYQDNLGILKSTNTEDGQVTLISHVLNSVLDTLGPTGWILGSSVIEDVTETIEMISYLKAEVSAALEGIEEATYLKGVLGEMLLCGKHVLAPASKKALTYRNSQRAVSQPIKPMTIALQDDQSSVLPLGLKPEPVISTLKVGAGGEVMRRSKRDIGRLKSKAVGKYTFERISV